VIASRNEATGSRMILWLISNTLHSEGQPVSAAVPM
jgi:hypothetical protein